MTLIKNVTIDEFKKVTLYHLDTFD